MGNTIQDPPPESGRRTHLLYFTCSYCILSRVSKLGTWLLVLRHYEHLFLFSMLILHVTLSRFYLNLLNIFHFTYTFSHANTEAHTHKHTCTISTQEKWRQPGTGAWLRGDSWSLSHLGYLYPGTTPVMIKLDHDRSFPWV